MSTRLGGVLHLLSQPEPDFKVGPLGDFDTGTRRFLCLTSTADDYLRRFFQAGLSDTVARNVATGTNGTPAYPDMLVVDASRLDRGGGETLLTVNYAGLMWAKADAGILVTKMDSETKFVLDAGNRKLLTLTISKATFTHRWTTSDGRPDARVGYAKNPPGISEGELAFIDQYFKDLVTTEVTVFSGWVISSRAPTSPSNAIDSAVWKVEDFYEYKIDKVPATG